MPCRRALSLGNLLHGVLLRVPPDSQHTAPYASGCGTLLRAREWGLLLNALQGKR